MEKCKIKHANQDRTPICGICRVKGHFRDDCPQLPLIRSCLDQDQHEGRPKAPEIKSWAQAHQYVRDREEHRQRLDRGAELQAMEEKRVAELEENRGRMLLKKRDHMQRSFQQNDSDDDMATGTQEETSEEGYHAAGETAELAKKKEELEGIIDGPEPKKVKKRKGKKKKKKNVSEAPSQHISPVTTPDSSPYHPDIGESNGTVCGSQPDGYLISFEEDSDETPDAIPMEKDDLDLTEDAPPIVTNSSVISASYPQPEKEAGKAWAALMDEWDKQQQQQQQQHKS